MDLQDGFDHSQTRVAPAPYRSGRGPGGERCSGPVLLTRAGIRLKRHAATCIVRRLAKQAGVTKTSPHTRCVTVSSAAPDAGVPLRDVQIAARHAGPEDHDALRPGPDPTEITRYRATDTRPQTIRYRDESERTLL
jgi:hypothetical protein